MRQLIAAVLIITSIISLIVLSFTFTQVQQEKTRLTSDIQFRSTILAESLKEAVEPQFNGQPNDYLQRIVDKFADKERLAGIAIYDNKGNIIAASSSLPKDISESQKITNNAMDADQINGDFINLKNNKAYVLAVPLHDDKSVAGALVMVQHAGYIDDRLTEIWRNNLIRLFLQVSALSLAILLLARWIFFTPIKNLVDSLKSARVGDIKNEPTRLTNSLFFRPLANEVSNIKRSLMEARLQVSEEAKLWLKELDSPWTEQRLKEFMGDILKGRTIFMVSNREPYIHTKNGGKINYFVPASGMATAIEPIMRACGGVWIAHGSGDADQAVVDNNDKIKVPPDEPKYTLKRIWLTEREEAGYYYGFSNEGLWPLCHIAHNRPIFRKEDWEQYKAVNQKFADSILLEIKNQDRPIVLIQDFHLSLVPKMIKAERPGAVVGLFWHIPWPNPESFSICPWKREILSGLLGADLLGFHTQLHCNNFIETVGRELEALIDFERFTVTKNSHTSYIKPFPVSIAFPNGLDQLDEKHNAAETEKVLKSLQIKTDYIGLGVDRLDYTKGILERFKAIEIFLNKYPQYRTQLTFIQVAAPSRTKVPKYLHFALEVEKEVERINAIFKTNNWKPIVLLEKHHSHQQLQLLYRLANFCLVTSLHDGMNLVAKEFIAARNDEKGVLILSQFTGASRELKDALIVNPYNAEQTADTIKESLEMKSFEQTKRMRDMREVVKDYNVYRWSAEILKNIVNIG